jgi:ubiquinone/menaquinone biosynthesis C-methylase UbiE
MGTRAARQRYYDLFSRFYDRFVAWHSGEPTGPILDLCCGTGAVTRALADSAPGGTVVVGLDFSWGMLSRGVAAARKAGRSGIYWVQADASALPFKDSVLDVVTCAYALYELKGQTRSIMLQEVARALVPGGRLLAMEHEVPSRRLLRILFSIRLAVIGAEGARAFLGGEIDEFSRVFSRVHKDALPTGKSKILTGTKG